MENINRVYEISNVKLHRFGCDGEFLVSIVEGKVVVISEKGGCFHELPNKPNFIHDCKNCLFLFDSWNKKDWKNVDEEYKVYDIYYCKKEKAIIARYGNDGHEYTSDPYTKGLDSHIERAKNLIQSLGYQLN